MNKITALEIKKFIISNYGVDPSAIMEPRLPQDHHMLDRAISESSKDNAEAVLNQIINKVRVFPDDKKKAQIIKTIERIKNRNSRGNRFAILLLMTALNNGTIDKALYKATRESWGMTDYTPEMEQFLTDPVERKDDFNLLN